MARSRHSIIPATLMLTALVVGTAAPTPAEAKGPGCELDVHGTDFTRPIYAPGQWVSARLDVSMFITDGQPLTEGTAPWRACVRSWADYTRQSPFAAVQQTEGSREHQHHAPVWFVDDGGALLIAGWVDPLQAGGTYVVTGIFGEREIARFEVAPNPDADLSPPELIGVSVTYDPLGRRRPVIQIEVDDASRAMPDVNVVGHPHGQWIMGGVRFREIGGRTSENIWLECTRAGLCEASVPRGSSRLVVDGLPLWDRFGNDIDVADHPLLDGVIIDLGSGSARVNIARGTLAPEPPTDEIEDDPPIADGADDPWAPTDELDPDVPTPDPAEDDPDATGTHRTNEGCNAAPGGRPAGGAVLAIALLMAWRRRGA